MNARDLPWQQFICRVCGLVYDERLGDPDGGLPPGTRFADIPDDWACPICGVGKADFEPHVPATATATAPVAGAVATPRGDAGVVIVGAGRAGWQVAQALRERSATLPITMVSACSGDVYDKPMLSVAVARGLTLERLVRESAAQAALRLGVRLRCDTHAVAIDAPRQRLRTTRGTLRFRHLVLAHGAAPALPAGWAADAVWRINDLHAYGRLRTALGDAPRRLALIGAGLVGCELANDLALAGHAITLIDQQPLPLGALLPAEASRQLQQAWAALPITFIGGAQVAGVARGQVRLADGRCFDVDEVIAATGLRTPGRLARSAGLAYDDAAGGIVVDPQHGRTSQPHIHALGDCVVVRGRASRFIEPIGRQAQAIAAGVLDQPWEPAEAAEPVLRIKTSSLPITLRGGLVSAGAWQWRTGDQSVVRS